MAGSGTYTGFNDRMRVGVYTRFTARKASDFINADTTGIVAIGLPMDWGKDGDITEVLGTELESGACQPKIGYTLNDDAIVPYRLALTGAYKAYFYKLNKGGQKASVRIGNIVAEALYTGIIGNSIKIVITENTPVEGRYCVEIFVDNVKKETKYVSNEEELLNINSAWVKFTGTTPTKPYYCFRYYDEMGAYEDIVFTETLAGDTTTTVDIYRYNEPTESMELITTLGGTAMSDFPLSLSYNNFTYYRYPAGDREVPIINGGSNSNPSSNSITPTTGAMLEGGTNGEIDSTSYDNFFTAVKYKMYDYIAVVGADTTVSDKVVEFANKQITNRGKYVGAVVYDKPLLNNKNVISVDQGLKCRDFTITTDLMPVFVASLRAGCSLGDCLDNNNMTELVGAYEIINPVNDDGDDDFVAALKQGRFLFAYWNDGTVVVEEDINTYVEYVENDPINYPADYRRNRLIATMNYIGNEASRRLNINVVNGKHADDDDGNTRYLVKSIVDDICTELKTATVIGSYDPQTDIIVNGVAGSSDKLYYQTFLKYKDSIRQVYGDYNIVLA